MPTPSDPAPKKPAAAGASGTPPARPGVPPGTRPPAPTGGTPAATPRPSIPVTRVLRSTSTPSSLRSRSVRSERSSGKPPGRTRPCASISTTRVVEVSMRRKSRRMTDREISANAPASSTPVGPAPTITRSNRSSSRLLGAPATSAISAFDGSPSARPSGRTTIGSGTSRPTFPISSRPRSESARQNECGIAHFSRTSLSSYARPDHSSPTT